MHTVTLLQTFEDGGMTYLKGSTVRLTTAAVAAWSALGRCAPLEPAPAPASPDA